MTNANAKPEARYAWRDGLRQQARSAAAVRRDRGGQLQRRLVLVARDHELDAGHHQRNDAAARPSTGDPMFYDSARDKVLVYMSYYTDMGVQPRRRDMGAAGHVVHDGSRRPCRGGTVLEVTFDPDRGKILLVGGYTSVAGVGAVYDADVWEWDTTTAVWTERPPAMGATVPSGRVNETLSYDTLRRVVVMFGGQRGDHQASLPSR